MDIKTAAMIQFPDTFRYDNTIPDAPMIRRMAIDLNPIFKSKFRVRRVPIGREIKSVSFIE